MRKCPECDCQRLYRDGLRLLSDGSKTQRWLCRECGHRFSDGKTLYNPSSIGSTRQICVSPERKARNLAEVEPLKDGLAGATQIGKSKIVEHAFWMRKEGFAESTITRRARLLTTLSRRGADMLDPESVKVTIAQQSSWSAKTKELAVEAYSCFLRMLGGKWKPPKYTVTRKLPFIPTQTEIEQLIAGCNNKTAAFLQLLAETGARAGEAWMLKWVDFNFENRAVSITPEKGSNPRQLPISSKLITMLNRLPQTQPEVFRGSLRHFARTYRKQRARICRKLASERIKQITFHTLRHFKATMEYAKTKNILHVKRLLGHKSVQSTELYTQLIDFRDDEYHSATAQTIEESKQLVEAGFEYVCDVDDVKLFRKRK